MPRVSPATLGDLLDDPLHPSQLLQRQPGTPGLHLAAAVLKQALEDLAAGEIEERLNATLWLIGAPARIPFELVAGGLGVEPRELRRAVLRKASALRVRPLDSRR